MAMLLSQPGNEVFESLRSAHDHVLSADASLPFWREATPVFVCKDPRTGHQAGAVEVRSRWTEGHLYLLFACPYRELYLHPDPRRDAETNELWNWDVAEVFLSPGVDSRRQYREFEVSPQGEWLDVDVDLDNPPHEAGWVWTSGMEVSTTVDATRRMWFGAMKIPFASLWVERAQAGMVFRANLFSCQGPPHARTLLAWRAPLSETFHVPDRFGLLRLA